MFSCRFLDPSRPVQLFLAAVSGIFGYLRHPAVQPILPAKARAGKTLGYKLTRLYFKKSQQKMYPSFFKLLMKQDWILATQSRRKRNSSLEKALIMKETKMQQEAWTGG
jgi:hypothetical protein